MSRQHQQQRFVFNALWELPIGDEEEKGGKSEENTGWLTRTFSHIEVAPILTLESGRPVNPLTGLDSNQSHAFPLSARPLALGRNSLSTPALATMDFRVLKYFPFGGAKRLDVVVEFFNLFNSANVSQINPVFGSGLTPIPGFMQPIAGTGARQIQFSFGFRVLRNGQKKRLGLMGKIIDQLAQTIVPKPNTCQGPSPFTRYSGTP